MATGDFRSQTNPGIRADHGIVSGSEPRFKENRYVTVNRIFRRARGMRGREGAEAGHGCGPKIRGDPRVGVFREGGCQMRHPPIQACGASGSVAPVPSEYMHNLNEPLMCIVFVPIISLLCKATPLAGHRG
jgi:hypothetical protein